MKLYSLSQTKNLTGKRVLVRVDFNAPIVAGHLESSDLWKLRASMPTVEYLLEQGAKVILITHLGRPNGKKDPKTSLRPIIKKFGQMIGRNIELWPQALGKLEARSKKLENGDIVALENIRWHKGEEANNPAFSKLLASLGDVYVDDAFGVIQRVHASNVGITKYLPSFAGFLFEFEVKNLYNLLSGAERPIVAVMGGSKISSKIGLIRLMLKKVDYLLLGGALANNVLLERDFEIGRSLVDRDAKLLHQNLMSNKIRLPLDARVSTSLDQSSKIVPITAVTKKQIIYDIGPDTVALYSRILKNARTIIWNGPLGYFEDRRYGRSTHELIDLLVKLRAKSYVGGGETVKAVLQSRLEDRLHFVSTGGGAMLSLLESHDWPALKALIKT